MNFCSYSQDKGEIIKNIEKNNLCYKVNYLDGTSKSFYTNDKEHLKELEKIMIEQAFDRDEEMYKSKKDEAFCNTAMSIVTIISYSCLNIITPKDLKTIFVILTAFIATANVNMTVHSKKQLKELKKYRLFLEMYKDLEKIENKDITKILELDPYYRKNLNITTLDDFKLREVKMIKKELKRRSNNKTY